MLSRSTIKEVHEPEKEHCKSYVYAFLSSIFFGVANFFSAEISSLGFNALWLYWAGALVSFLLYHLYTYVQFKREGKTGYLSSENSMYFVTVDPDEHGEADDEILNDREDQVPNEIVLSPERVFGTIMRGVTLFISQIAVLGCFYYAGKSGVNPGIISVTFNTNLVFTAIYFSVFFG